MALQLDRPLAVFDLETTGTDIVNDRIVEIGIIRMETDGSSRSKILRVNPEMPIPDEASSVHGIYDEDVAMSPTFAQLADELMEFMDGCDLGGFNSNRFDVPILVEEFFRVGKKFSLDGRRMIDAHTLYVIKEKRDLTSALKFYCDKELVDAHSAEADAKATLDVILGQLEKYPDLEQNLDKVDKLVNDQQFIDTGRRLVMHNGEACFNFGKHKGRPVLEVLEREPGYYSWMMKAEFPSHTKQKLTEIKNALRHGNNA